MEFLQDRGDRAIRKEIRGIKDSYHHYWDLLAELLQNARDAISRKRSQGKNEGPFFIRLIIDASSNSVEIFDNGIGISKSNVHQMLAPGEGDKDGTNLLEVGEKGVGLTYALFSGNRFNIQTRKVGDSETAGEVNGALSWLNELQGTQRPVYTELTPTPEEKSIKFQSNDGDTQDYSTESYTRIKISGISPSAIDLNFFTFTADEFSTLLRTRTAVGITSGLSNDTPCEFDVYLDLRLPNGNFIRKIDARYITPHKLLSPSNTLKLPDVQAAFVNKTSSEARQKYIGNKTIWATQQLTIDNWNISVYGAMFPSNKSFEQLATSALKITTQEIAETLFTSGIFVGTKGMPTGMRIEPKPSSGQYPAYYKRCIFFVESQSLKFDLGRKSLHYKHVAKLQEAVAQLFTSLENVAPFQGDGRAQPAQPQGTTADRAAEIQQQWTNAKALPNLNDPRIHYMKQPGGQEAAVAAIFHELVGAQILRGYRTLRTSYVSRYDIFAEVDRTDGTTLEATIEFKFDLSSLARDLTDGLKYLSDIHLLIAWDANEQALKDAGFDLEPTSYPKFHGETHILTTPIPGVQPIPVLLLRTLFSRRNQNLP